MTEADQQQVFSRGPGPRRRPGCAYQFVVMPLTLRRALLSPAHADRQDWIVLDDGLEVGRIYEDRSESTPRELRWFWSITRYVPPRLNVRTHDKVGSSISTQHGRRERLGAVEIDPEPTSSRKAPFLPVRRPQAAKSSGRYFTKRDRRLLWGSPLHRPPLAPARRHGRRWPP